MPQIAIAMVQPAAPQAPAPGAPANNNVQSFSPHLDKAMANRKDQPSSRENIAKAKEQGANKAESRSATADSEEILKTSPEPPPTEEQVARLINIMNYATPDNQTDMPEQPVLEQPLANTSFVFQFLTNNFNNNLEDTGGKQMASTQQAMPNVSAGVLLPLPLAETMNLATADPNISALSKSLPGEKAESNAFLLELQKIIENSNESGTVTISVSDKAGKTASDKSSLQTTTATAVNEPLSMVQTSGATAGNEHLSMAGCKRQRGQRQGTNHYP